MTDYGSHLDNANFRTKLDQAYDNVRQESGEEVGMQLLQTLVRNYAENSIQSTSSLWISYSIPYWTYEVFELIR